VKTVTSSQKKSQAFLTSNSPYNGLHNLTEEKDKCDKYAMPQNKLLHRLQAPFPSVQGNTRKTYYTTGI
jgi:hypothetical protein